MFKHRFICIMSLEKDLQQKKPFPSEHVKGTVNIMYTSRFIETNLSRHYKKFGITMKQFNILRILKGAGEPISTQIIRERMIDRMSDISRIVDRLVEKGHISKCVNKEDKRLVDVTLNESGENLLDELKDELTSSIHDTQNLTQEEAVQLNYLLDKIRGYNN